MMMLLLQLAKRRPRSMILPFFTTAQHSRCLSSSPTQDPSFIVDYLITSVGVSPDKAAIISKPFTHIKSPEKPDAVLRYLKNSGFSEADIKTLVTCQPRFLCASPENTLEPKLRALREVGLSIPAIIKIVLSSNAALLSDGSITIPRIKFWMDFLGGDEAALVRAFNQNRGLVNHDITRRIAPRISLLQSYGLSAKDIQRIVCRSGIITRPVGVLEDMLNRTKESGFKPCSGMFVLGLQVMGCVTREVLQKRMDLLKSFGWSEYEFLSALRKEPGMAALSDETLQVKMNFLLGEAKCDISYIASHPLLLKYSLAKRLRPRLHVLNLLEPKGLSIPGQGFHTAMKVTDTKFVERYILPHKDKIPELCDICLADCA